MLFSYLESLFLSKCFRKNQRSLLFFGTKIDTAMAINIHPCIKTVFGGFDFESEGREPPA